ncbi:MAG: hypothetical protein FWD60_03530 [Candidatus Azobacteroides sp.]|nr:hypothetical protein [Candidatus Azobacteroides sp.]
MKKYFKYTLLIVSLLISWHVSYSQSGKLIITVNQTTSGSYCNIMTGLAQANAKNYMSLPANNLQKCEDLKREVLTNPDFQNSCFTVQCDCVGYPASSSNSDSNGSNPFNNSQINFNGPAQGQSVFSPAPYVDVEYWIDGVRYVGSVQRNIDPDFYNSLKKNYNMRELDNSSNFKPYVAKSGHEPSDVAYAGLINNYINPTTEGKNIKGTEQPIGQDDLNKLQGMKKDLLNANSSPEEGYAALVNIANKMPETSQSGINLNVNDLSELAPVESLQSETSLPPVKMSSNSPSSNKNLATQKKQSPSVKDEAELKRDWMKLGIDVSEFGAGLAIKATSTVGILAIANVSLYAELGRYLLKPEEYGWGGNATKKIFFNAIENTAKAVVFDNSVKIIGASKYKIVDAGDNSVESVKIVHKTYKTAQKTYHYLSADE